jgi:hypothetical protein
MFGQKTAFRKSLTNCFLHELFLKPCEKFNCPIFKSPWIYGFFLYPYRPIRTPILYLFSVLGSKKPITNSVVRYWKSKKSINHVHSQITRRANKISLWKFIFVHDFYGLLFDKARSLPEFQTYCICLCMIFLGGFFWPPRLMAVAWVPSPPPPQWGV